ncbi:hypothetical protein ACHAXA_003302 [Cyclostephanos tholiformis]|uniref:Uncharacterized protein n=1 Tax=Cyclostephanos tholiformis TaxID=382380 RepID=A0ABD3R1K0_9STRA
MMRPSHLTATTTAASPPSPLLHLLLILLHSSRVVMVAASAASSFDPYLLDGGLVTAVAGRDYALIASDTRLTDGGYGVRSRNHLRGRIWSVQSSSMTIDFDDDVDERRLLSSNPRGVSRFEDDVVESSTERNRRRRRRRRLDDDECNVPSPIFVGSAGCSSDCESLKRRMRLEIDALPRRRSSTFGGGGGCNLGIRSVANLLQQVLYGRRSFPYYSFCVVAGLDDATYRRRRRRRRRHGGSGHRRRGGVERMKDEGGWEGDSAEGAVYVYDAIGSYEKVAVACAGTGRELLQPILDRSFSSSSRCSLSSSSSSRPDAGGRPSRHQLSTCNHVGDKVEDEDENDDKTGATETTTAIATTADVTASRQRTGVAGALISPVRTIVDCTWEESVDKVARAYASVSEREISVGDEVVICVVLARKDDVPTHSTEGRGGETVDEDDNKDDHEDAGGGGGAMVRVFRYPLKRH